MKLASPITSKSARPGDPVRAVTAFPVTVNTQLAIPVGTYVEGVIDQVTKRGPSGPTLQMHFTRILFANGYSVAVQGTNTQALLMNDSEPDSQVADSFEGAGGANYVLAAQQMPGPFPKPSSHIGLVIGIGAAFAAATIIGIALASHHAGGSNGVIFDTGWQFEMVLQSPLTIDLASATAAARAPSAQ